MNLVPVFVKADDGLFYKNPIIGERDWFISFSDDDPLELIVRANVTFDAAVKRVCEAGFSVKRSGRFRRMSRRFYGQRLHQCKAIDLEYLGGRLPVSLLVAGKGSVETEDVCIIYGANL